jgi:mannosyl-glycoprotein endo-beta-N-acetylglucosaminidase
VPVSIASVLALPPETSAVERSTDTVAREGERAQFARELERVQNALGAARPRAATALVPATRTRLSGAEAASALGTAWEQTTGRAPSPRTLSILTGQWAHETGRGASMLNYNFGGIKGSGPSGMSAVYKTREGSGADEVRVMDRFRAYGSAAEGATDYMSLLVRRYPEAVQAAEQGDPGRFVQALKARGYFTGDEASYIKSVSTLANQALGAGFDALGQAGEGSDIRVAKTEELASAFADPGTGETVAGRAHWGASSFADEVSRAHLLMSALRIGQNGERRG